MFTLAIKEWKKSDLVLFLFSFRQSLACVAVTKLVSRMEYMTWNQDSICNDSKNSSRHLLSIYCMPGFWLSVLWESSHWTLNISVRRILSSPFYEWKDGGLSPCHSWSVAEPRSVGFHSLRSRSLCSMPRIKQALLLTSGKQFTKCKGFAFGKMGFTYFLLTSGKQFTKCKGFAYAWGIWGLN